MSAIKGPNIVKNGLVLALDAANTRSFKGEPTTNLLTGISNSFGTQDTTFFKTNYGSEIVDIPVIGKRTSTHVNIFNDFNGGSGACCPSPFSFGDFSVSPSTTYTYQIIFRTSTGYSHPNYMYQYQFNGGTYVTEFGLLDNSRIDDLGDGWKHGWGTFTTNSSTNRILAFLFHYEYGIFNKIQVAGIMLSQRSSPVNPKFILPTGTSRGATVATGGGWADLTGNGNHGQLVNGSTYNSSNLGSLAFDGIDDYINFSTNIQSGYTAASYEFLVETGSITTSEYRQIYIQESSTWIALYAVSGTVFFGIDLNNGSGWFDNNGGWNTGARTTSAIASNTKYHLVYTWNGSSVKVYLNGILESTTSTLQASNGRQNVTQLGTGTTPRRIGSRNNQFYWNNKIFKTSFYNRELTLSEVQQNFNATRRRYGL